MKINQDNTLKCVLISFLVSSNEECDILKAKFTMFNIVIEYGIEGYAYEVVILEASKTSEDYDEELEKAMGL